VTRDLPPESTDDHQGWRDWITNVTNDDDGIERLIIACRAGVNIGALLIPRVEREAA
jgi:hypothetical protein